jgi:hypothetical protein
MTKLVRYEQARQALCESAEHRQELIDGINAARKARIELASAAVGVLRKHETIERWREVGDGALALQEEAMSWAAINRPKGRRYNVAWSLLAAHWPKLAEIGKASRSHAIWLASEWTTITEWLHTLPNRERLRINHPAAIRRRYDAAAHPKEPRRADASRAADAAYEDLRAEIERLKHELARALAEIERLRGASAWRGTQRRRAEMRNGL